MQRAAPIILMLALVPIAAGGEGLTLEADEPLVKPAKPGEVRGTVTPAEKVERIRAVSRVTGKEYEPGTWNAKTGEFVFKGLPGDATYDVCLTLTDGRDVEGIDLEFVDARLLRLAAERRKQLGLPPEREHTFSEKDAREIIEHTMGLDDFLDLRRILYLKGHGRRATMLVEPMRTRDFHAGGGAYVWRIELWYFENHFGGWVKVANQERTLRRQRTSPEQWRRISVEYYPELSVFVDRAGRSERVTFQVPDEPDPSRGRPANTPVKLETKPHVLGAAEAEEDGEAGAKETGEAG